MTKVLGWALLLVGGVWFGQGISLIPGSFMTGSAFWAVAGAVSVLAGGGLLRRTRAKP